MNKVQHHIIIAQYLNIDRRRDADPQESLRPESGADLDHGALPAIQASDQTRDPQTGDVGAVLHSSRECGECTDKVETH